MASKLSVVCLLGLLVETISSQCVGPNILGPNLPLGPGLPLGPNLGPNIGSCGCGNPFPVSSIIGPSAPVSGYLTIANSAEPTVSLFSDNLLISGPVVVAGKLPFAGTVSLEGALPAAGAGAVNYGCGNGVGIVNECPLQTGIVGPNYLGVY